MIWMANSFLFVIGPMLVIKKVPIMSIRKNRILDKKKFHCVNRSRFAQRMDVVDMLGPYYANQNNATIMRDIIGNHDGMCNLLEPGDAFVVDRGFRDVKEYLESKDYKVLIPAMKDKRNQLTTAESNASRYVTKI